MSILVFYSLKHHYFRCDYTNSIATLNYEKGKIDYFNRLYIQKITDYTDTPKIIEKLKNKLKSKKIYLEIKIGEKLVSLGYKLGASKPPKPKNNNWRRWL